MGDDYGPPLIGRWTLESAEIGVSSRKAVAGDMG